MENKYDDFCLCSPDTFEQIAKKYNEQIAKKNLSEQKPVLSNAQSIFDLANQNVCELENLLLQELSTPKRMTLQKIYIKSCHLKKLIHGEILTHIKQKTHNSPYAQKNRTPLQNILGVKKICICNLCKMLKLFFPSSLTNKEMSESVVDIITLWADI